ncbi:N2227-domain-containing protein [Sistotremastrum suecicum HHB10207 ss-3]|uniref:N2227-domain-containing protein n=1 Tax=Sistotremastrum suecicum HHB10207 ss-3 TaxID=1314776 RepID=A0A165Z080_9AGAM|nr:N2227-domain-containing protein [Sistotremastrum suecicum HHB10207 ss-3]
MALNAKRGVFLVLSGILILGFALAFERYPEMISELKAIIWGTAPTPQLSAFSLPRAVNSYSRYAEEAGWEPSKMRNTYAKIGSRRRIGSQLGYPKKLERFRETIAINSRVTNAIVALAHEEYGDEARTTQGDGTDLGRVREALKHFVRDWSEEGREEREKTFRPILDVLEESRPTDRQGASVLIPGAGLGRLAWEISQLGYNTTAVEISPYMNLAHRFLLSPKTTTMPNQHTIHPYSHWFSHQRTTDSLMRAITFPDMIPRLSENLHLIEGDFLSLPTPKLQVLAQSTPSPPSPSNANDVDSEEHGYDYIVTLFFIDTSLNILSTLQKIQSLLRPGGTWINLGPLLWTGGASSVMELSLDEMMEAVRMSGFVVQEGSDGVRGRRTVECEYTADKNAMMKWVYQAEVWVARKTT